MKPQHLTINIAALVLLGVLLLGTRSNAQAPAASYPTMAPLKQYLIDDRDAEIALARTGAPDSISHDAEIQVLSPHGYETAVKGKNGFVCLVQRSFAASADDPVFWNSRLRGPTCFNA